MRPIDVLVTDPEEPFSAGRTYDLMCTSRGSRPPAIITWWLGSQRLRPIADQVRGGGEVCCIEEAGEWGKGWERGEVCCRGGRRSAPPQQQISHLPTSSSLTPPPIQQVDTRRKWYCWYLLQIYILSYLRKVYYLPIYTVKIYLFTYLTSSKYLLQLYSTIYVFYCCCRPGKKVTCLAPYCALP